MCDEKINHQWQFAGFLAAAITDYLPRTYLDADGLPPSKRSLSGQS